MGTERCSAFSLTRRKFLEGMGFLGYTLLSTQTLLGEAIAEELSAPTPKITPPRAKVGLIFTHIPPQYPTWPHIGYDYESRKKELETKLREACPNTDFSVGTAMNVQQAQDLLKQMEDVDGFIAYIIGIWTGAPNVIVHSGKPVLLVDDLYGGCGEFIGVYAGAIREKLPVVGISSSDFKDVARAARLFEVMKGIRNARIVDIIDTDISDAADRIKKAVGIDVIGMGLSELNSRYEKADNREAERWADRWIKEAKRVVEPTKDEIIRSGKMHLALTSIMSEKGAEAITIDCLGGFYSGKLKAYPCLSFRQLNDDGFVGACEADLSSTIAMIMMRHLAGRPGMISDPVFDFSKSWIIYAHCVGPTKVFGPNGPRNDFIIRSHAEDRKGAAIQSLMPLGEVVTTIETNPWEKAIVVHTGKTVANVEEEKACRTKLAAEARIDRILTNWRWGWHRVTFYGDWRKDVKNLGTLMGFQVYDEDM